MPTDLDRLIRAAAQKDPKPLYVVAGDRVLAEPAAERLAGTVAERAGTEPQIRRRPANLGDLLADLKTFSLFDPAKVLVAVDSAALAEPGAAGGLLEEAAKVLPVDRPADPQARPELSSRERHAALRLMRALRLFQLDPYAGHPRELLEELPAEAFATGGSGGKRARKPTKAQLERLRPGLADLLELGRAAELRGYGEGDAEELANLLQVGLPPGHCLILAESSVARAHPVVAAAKEAGTFVDLGGVEAGRRGGWEGLDALVEELEHQTGSGAEARAIDELARRTLRQAGRGQGVDAQSTGRFAAEYRKLAAVAAGGTITAAMVESAVEDRGREEVWGILDAIGAGDRKKALAGLERMVATSDDPIADRLGFFALLAGFAKHLSAIGSLVEARRLPRAERNYRRFKDRVAPQLQAQLAGGRKNPLAGLHPYRLHRAYLAAARLEPERLRGLGSRILQAELALKGESRVPDAALSALVAELAR